MNITFFASLLALSMLAPGAQAKDNAIRISGFGAAVPAHADDRCAQRPACASLRISDDLDARVGRVGLPALMALNVVADNGPSLLRVVPVRTKAPTDDLATVNNLVGTLRTARTGTGYRLPQLDQLASEIDAKDKQATFSAMGPNIDL